MCTTERMIVTHPTVYLIVEKREEKIMIDFLLIKEAPNFTSKDSYMEIKDTLRVDNVKDVSISFREELNEVIRNMFRMEPSVYEVGVRKYLLMKMLDSFQDLKNEVLNEIDDLGEMIGIPAHIKDQRKQTRIMCDEMIDATQQAIDILETWTVLNGG